MVRGSRQERAVQRRIGRWREADAHRRDDAVTVEEPLEIRLGQEAIAVTMRTPCDDFDLVAGFLLSEGIIASADQLGALSYCAAAVPPNEENVIEAHLTPDPDGGPAFDPARLKRNFYASSSCGVCGKASIEAIQNQAPVLRQDFVLRAEVLYGLDAKMRQAQAVFERTGSLHAAALFSLEGELLVLREDVGRHNAVDKVIGHYVRRGALPPVPAMLMVSGRVGFEIAQKALMAGIGAVAAVSAPASLAVDMADEAGMILVGFLRGRGFNVYAGGERIVA
jgi:FdhD protein